MVKRPRLTARHVGGIVLLLDGGLLFAAQRLFDRERLMTRWG